MGNVWPKAACVLNICKTQLMAPDQTSQHLQQVSIVDGWKKGRIPSFCVPAAQDVSLFHEKKTTKNPNPHCWQPGMYFQKVKGLLWSKAHMMGNSSQLLVCTGLVTFVSSAIWFSDFHSPQISQLGMPCRHTNTHHQHHSSLTATSLAPTARTSQLPKACSTKRV